MDILLRISPDQQTAFIREIKNALKEELAEFKSTNPINESQDEVYLDRREVCKFLRCSLATLYNYQKANKIVCLKIGRKVLFKKSEVLSNLIQTQGRVRS
jgi:excisionase family DNA binding protein